MSFLRSMFKPKTPAERVPEPITDTDTLETAIPKFVYYMKYELNKDLPLPYYHALEIFMNRLNTPFRIRRVSRGNPEIDASFRGIHDAVANITQYNKELGSSLFNFSLLLRIAFRKDTKANKEMLDKFSAGFPEIPPAESASMMNLRRRINALYSSTTGGRRTRKVKRSRTRRHRTGRKSRSTKRVAH